MTLPKVNSNGIGDIRMAMSLQADKAYDHYLRTLLRPIRLKRTVAKQYGLTHSQVHSSEWELFGAVLLDMRGSSHTYGADLASAEVKSTRVGGAGTFEYQYHRDSWQAKLAEDAHISHLFVLYSADYENLEVYILRADQVHNIILGWKPLAQAAYPPHTTGGRCRPGIPVGFVKAQGRLVMRISGGLLKSYDSTPLSSLLASPRCRLPGCAPA
jgi:hypothetical protein